jgi:hypothetical protein
MKFRKFILLGVILSAVTASFAFKPAKQFGIPAAFLLPSGSSGFECGSGVLADDDCSTLNTGAQCTIYWNDANPEAPAYLPGLPTCTYPLYHQF